MAKNTMPLLGVVLDEPLRLLRLVVAGVVEPLEERGAVARLDHLVVVGADGALGQHRDPAAASARLGDAVGVAEPAAAVALVVAAGLVIPRDAELRVGLVAERGEEQVGADADLRQARDRQDPGEVLRGAGVLDLDVGLDVLAFDREEDALGDLVDRRLKRAEEPAASARGRRHGEDGGCECGAC
jgi:hypothetical protein